MNKKICLNCDGRKECTDKDKFKKFYCNNYTLIYKNIDKYAKFNVCEIGDALQSIQHDPVCLSSITS